MKIRTFFAVLLCKLARGLLRLLRRGGTAFPGRVALKVYPQVLGVLSRGVRVILVTGTNGKTTSSRGAQLLCQPLGREPHLRHHGGVCHAQHPDRAAEVPVCRH